MAIVEHEKDQAIGSTLKGWPERAIRAERKGWRVYRELGGKGIVDFDRCIIAKS